MTSINKRWAAVIGAGVLLLAGLGLVLSADPGSPQDPLATIGYVQRYAQFARVELRSGQTLNLGAGSELVLIEPRGIINLAAYDAKRELLVNLTSGEPVAQGALGAFQHYVNAGGHDLGLRFSTDVTALVRGVWQ